MSGSKQMDWQAAAAMQVWSCRLPGLHQNERWKSVFRRGYCLAAVTQSWS